MEGALTGLASRRLSGVLTQRLTEEPTIVLNGPRTVGKSTLLDRLARDAGRTVIDLDDPAALVLYTGRHAYTHEEGHLRSAVGRPVGGRALWKALTTYASHLHEDALSLHA